MLPLSFLSLRTNEFGMPTVRSIFSILEKDYPCDFYGYINGDIIQSTTLFDVLVFLKGKIDEGVIPSQV